MCAVFMYYPIIHPTGPTLTLVWDSQRRDLDTGHHLGIKMMWCLLFSVINSEQILIVVCGSILNIMLIVNVSG
jgi:hypothetical protein